jgi:hypothetical protein
MSAGAAIAAMAEQAKMKACEKYMLKLSESGDVFEMVVWSAGVRTGAGTSADLYTYDLKSLEHIGLVYWSFAH